MDHMKKKIMIVSVSFAMTMGGINAAESASVAISGTFRVYEPQIGALAHEDTVTGVFDPVAATFGVVGDIGVFPIGLAWTAYNGTLFGPGTYTFNTVDTAVEVTITINPGEMGGHILWAVASSVSDVFLKWDSSGISLDFDEDFDGIPGYEVPGIPGYAQVPGSFLQYWNLNFDLSQQPHVVPVPAAVWLFGSGLLGLLGLTRRKKHN